MSVESLGEYLDPATLQGHVKLEQGSGIILTLNEANNSLIISAPQQPGTTTFALVKVSTPRFEAVAAPPPDATFTLIRYPIYIEIPTAAPLPATTFVLLKFQLYIGIPLQPRPPATTFQLIRGHRREAEPPATSFALVII